MTTETRTQATQPSMGAPLPDHGVIPPVWSRITNLDVDRGEGSFEPATRFSTTARTARMSGLRRSHRLDACAVVPAKAPADRGSLGKTPRTGNSRRCWISLAP